MYADIIDERVYRTSSTSVQEERHQALKRTELIPHRAKKQKSRRWRKGILPSSLNRVFWSTVEDSPPQARKSIRILHVPACGVQQGTLANSDFSVASEFVFLQGHT